MFPTISSSNALRHDISSLRKTTPRSSGAPEKLTHSVTEKPHRVGSLKTSQNLPTAASVPGSSWNLLIPSMRTDRSASTRNRSTSELIELPASKSVHAKQFDAKVVNALLDDHLQTAGHWNNAELYASEYRRNGYVAINDFLPPEMHATALSLVAKTIDDHGVERNKPNVFSGTARNFISVGTERMRIHAPLMNILYRDPGFLHLISQIFGTKTRPLGKYAKTDEFPAHLMRGVGDTLGTHLDPATATAVMILRAPPKDAGGALEYCRPPAHVYDEHGLMKLDDATSMMTRFPGHVHRRQPETNSIYFFDGSRLPHHVLPLNRNLSEGRVNVTMSFAQPLTDTRPTEYKNELYKREVASAFPEAASGAVKS